MPLCEIDHWRIGRAWIVFHVTVSWLDLSGACGTPSFLSRGSVADVVIDAIDASACRVTIVIFLIEVFDFSDIGV
jgi:hypothetical protein